MSHSEKNLELARLYFERCDVLKAIEVLEPTIDVCIESKDYDYYLEAMHILFRAYAETMAFEKIIYEKKRLDGLVKNHNLDFKSRTHYVLGLCASSQRDYKQALWHCQKALDLGIQNNEKENVCNATLGIAISYYYMERYDESLKEIYNLQVFMNVMELPQISLSAHILKGQILRKIQKYDQAIEVLWQSYEVLKRDRNFYSYITILFSLGCTYRDAGRLKEAKNYALLAQRTVDKVNLQRLSNAVDDLVRSLGGQTPSEYDLIFDTRRNVVIERSRGKVDFKNQFILIDLLKLFLTYPGQTFTKESLVKLIWKQSYNPAVHDNKIYVTIKRLRQLLEPDVERPKYIFRSKNGYYLDKNISVHVQEDVQRRD